MTMQITSQDTPDAVSFCLGKTSAAGSPEDLPPASGDAQAKEIRETEFSLPDPVAAMAPDNKVYT